MFKSQCHKVTWCICRQKRYTVTGQCMLISTWNFKLVGNYRRGGRRVWYTFYVSRSNEPEVKIEAGKYNDFCVRVAYFINFGGAISYTLPSYSVFVCWYVLDLWGITFPVGYHWKCLRSHCACAESRDPWVGGLKQLHFWYARQRFACSLCNFGGSTMKVIKVICENNTRHCVKRRMSFCACAKSRDLLKVP